MALERELKFEADPNFVTPDLSDLAEGGHLASEPARQLAAEYYDTKDLRLARFGVTVRHRTEDGDGGTWTAKLPAADDRDDARARYEIEVPGSADAIPPAISKRAPRPDALRAARPGCSYPHASGPLRARDGRGRAPPRGRRRLLSQSGLTNVYVFGGASAVSDTTASDLKSSSTPARTG